VTEHARAIDHSLKAWLQRASTSGLGAALSTGDFLIALSQVPEVKGASWHALNGSGWQLFDATVRHKDLRERPVYWGLRVLRSVELPRVLGTVTTSPNDSGYAGGYDIRASAFTDKAGERVALWVVNRAPYPTETEVAFSNFRCKTLAVNHRFIKGEAGVHPDMESLVPEIRLEPIASRAETSMDGRWSVTLPPASVSAFEFTPTGSVDACARRS
jgi:hypothetical protein